MTKYLLLDTYNIFFRAIHSTRASSDIDEKVAFALHLTLQSINAAWREQKANHMVMMLEGRSWRKDFYLPYKKNREVARSAATEKEKEEGAAFFGALSDLIEFFREKTNVTVLQHPKLEADDLIAGWIQSHLQDEHVIISSDSDYYQLLSEKVTMYNGCSHELHTISGIFDSKGKRIIDKKTKLPKEIPNPEFMLFEKIVRGDSSDNVFSAYPGCRTKGSKNKVGLLEAFEDRSTKGFNFNNFMLQRWVDHEGKEHRVLDDYNRNRVLIDLTAQPEEIRAIINETVGAVTKKNMSQIGAKFLKFCGKYNLVKLSEQATEYAHILSSTC